MPVCENLERSTVTMWGKKFETIVFKTDKDVNNFLEKNPDYALLKIEREDRLHVATN